jgi:hypothetical protein
LRSWDSGCSRQASGERSSTSGRPSVVAEGVQRKRAGGDPQPTLSPATNFSRFQKSDVWSILGCGQRAVAARAPGKKRGRWRWRGPKSTVWEVQIWTTTTVREAQAAKERFARLSAGNPSSGKPAGNADEPCEVLRWVLKTIDEALKLRARDPGLMMRCVECKKPVRPHSALLTDGTSPTPHFDHREANPNCSRSEG